MLDSLSTPHKIIFYVYCILACINLLVFLFSNEGVPAKTNENRKLTALVSFALGLLFISLLIFGSSQ